MFSAPGLVPVFGETAPALLVVKAFLLAVRGFLTPNCTSGVCPGSSTGFLGATASRGGGVGLMNGSNPQPRAAGAKDGGDEAQHWR